MTIKVLVVDDTIFYRKIVSDTLSELPDIEVVGTANNGKIALSRIKTLKPDLITLDVEMPVMNGLELLEEIQSSGLTVDTIMLSSKTEKGSLATMRSLELGAFDFVAKPDDKDPLVNKKLIREGLVKLLRAYKLRKSMRGGLKGTAPAKAKAISKSTLNKPLKRNEKSQVIAIGISTGGPNALNQLIPAISGTIGVPILLVQHMPPVFTASLAASLDKKSALTVTEAKDGEEIKINTVYLAPGGTQMKVATGGGLKKIIRISDDPPENNCKPSVDFLFRSVAREYGSKSTCVIMTGMGTDGKLGMKITKASGALSIAQEAESCVVYGMPKAVIEAGLVDIVAPLNNIAAEISRSV